MGKDESPILLQRRCGLIYIVRPQEGDASRLAGVSFEEATALAREMLTDGSVRIDLVMAYDGVAANPEALGQHGQKETRLATWEVFAADAVYCPAGRNKLPPLESAAANADEAALPVSINMLKRWMAEA